MNAGQWMAFVSVVVNGGLYCVLVFAAGLQWGNRWAVLLSIAALGMGYLGAQFYTFHHSEMTMAFVVLAVACGALAGLLLAIL